MKEHRKPTSFEIAQLMKEEIHRIPNEIMINNLRNPHIIFYDEMNNPEYFASDFAETQFYNQTLDCSTVIDSMSKGRR